MASATTLFNLGDAHVRIYNMEGSVIKAELTPSAGFLYLQDVKLTESPQVIVSPKVGGFRQGMEVAGYTRTLTIGKVIVPDDEGWTIALDPLRDYYIRIYQYDPLLGETIAASTLWNLSFCRPKDRSWNTGGRSSLSRVWDVGQID